ncbi:MAG: hypothetical protein ACOX8W_12665 [bacterium]|jgi:hypothetical protein
METVDEDKGQVEEAVMFGCSGMGSGYDGKQTAHLREMSGNANKVLVVS